MDRVPVSSSNVASVGYDEASATLEVEFHNGGLYQYFDVPRHVFEAFTSGAGSVGEYLAREVKGVYRYARL